MPELPRLSDFLARVASYARHRPWCAWRRGACDCGFEELFRDMKMLEDSDGQERQKTEKRIRNG